MAFGKSSLGLVVAAFCVLLSACATTDLAGTVDANLAPPDAPAPPQEYRISPNDKLSISVYPATVTNFSMPSVRVDATGNILFPATGILVAQGKTSGDASGMATSASSASPYDSSATGDQDQKDQDAQSKP